MSIKAAAKTARTIQMSGAISDIAAASSESRRFLIEAYDGGLMELTGFELPVVVEIGGIECVVNPPLLIDHKSDAMHTLGSIEAGVEVDGKYVIEGTVTGKSPLATQVIEQFDAGQKWHASIGASVIDAVDVPAGQVVEANGSTFTGPLTYVSRCRLTETSVLPRGAAQRTQVNLAAAAVANEGASTMPTFEEYVMSLGIDLATLTEEAKTALMVSYNAAYPAEETANAGMDEEETLMPAVAAGAVDFTATRKAYATEQRRVHAIQSVAKNHPNICAKAIEAGWTSERAELEVLKAEQLRTRPTSFTAAQGNVDQSKVLEAAFSMQRHHADTEKMYSDQVLQAAHTQFRGGLSIQRMILMAAAANGMSVQPGMRIGPGNYMEAMRYAMGRTIQATAFSSINLSGILSNVANKELLQGYMEEDATWREIAEVKSVSDFKTVTAYRLLDNMEYELLPPGGRIKHGTLGEESLTRSAKTYAKMFTITREDIINDDLNSFDDLRTRLGRGSAKKFNAIFWAAFMNNSSFFTSGLTNYISGATSNLGTDGVGLGLGVTQFRKMKTTTADGKKVGVGGRPVTLLVPPELEHNADKLYVGSNLNTGSAAGEENTFKGKYRPVVAWQLSDADYTGNSATAWYLFGDQYKPMCVSFLNGQETPTIESDDADFDQLGIQFRGYHDFGCDQWEKLSGLKSKGAA